MTSTRKRQRKRRREVSLDLSSSSEDENSSSKPHESQSSKKPVESVGSSSDSQASNASSGSSAVFSSSDEDVPKSRAARKKEAAARKATQSTQTTQVNGSAMAQDGDVPNELDDDEEEAPPPPPRVPTPFLFWDKDPAKEADLILGDDLPPSISSPSQPDSSSGQSRFRDFYLSSLVQHFGPQLDSLRKERDFSHSKLSSLITSLASGANTYDSQARQIVLDSIPPSTSDNDKENGQMEEDE